MLVYSQDGSSLYVCMAGTSGIFYGVFYDHDTKVSIKTKQPHIFSWIHGSFAHIPTTGTLTNGNVELSSRKWVSYGCHIFYERIILH